MAFLLVIAIRRYITYLMREWQTEVPLAIVGAIVSFVVIASSRLSLVRGNVNRKIYYFVILARVIFCRNYPSIRLDSGSVALLLCTDNYISSKNARLSPQSHIVNVIIARKANKFSNQDEAVR